MSLHKIARAAVPNFAREAIHKKRVLFLFDLHYNKKLKKIIEDNNFLTEELVAETMRRHDLSCQWAGVYTALNGIPSRDYVSDNFFYSQIQPRVNNIEFVNAYTDKNFYDITPMGKYTPRAVMRKISGRYFDGAYAPVAEKDIESIIRSSKGDLVIKPAIESGSGKDVWIGPAADAYKEFMSRTESKDTIVQECLRGNAFSQRLNPTSFNTVRVMTGFTGSKYVTLGSALRMGHQGAKVDNMTAGGLIVGVREDGSLFDFAVDKNFNKYESHPHIPFIFKNERVPEYGRINATCLELHKYLPHFGMVSWDIAIDDAERVRVIEYNLDWQGINILQIPHGPIFGQYKDEFKKTYNLPDWEK